MSYTDVNWADEYFALRAFSDAWNTAGQNKPLYLKTATNQIKDYCAFVDEKGAFVYEEDSKEHVIPEWLKRATCEQALHLLNLVKDPTQNDKKLKSEVYKRNTPTQNDKKLKNVVYKQKTPHVKR